jgi:hypothetical protein
MKMMLGDYCLAELCAAHSGNGYHAMMFGDTDYRRVAASLDGAQKCLLANLPAAARPLVKWEGEA